MRRFLKKKYIAVVFAGAVLIAGVWYFVLRDGDGMESTFVMRGDVKEELILTGEVVAKKHAVLQFSSSGKIAWVGVSEGDRVRRGQAIAKLDTALLNSTFQQAKSDLRSAEATLERVYDGVKDSESDETFTEKETRTAAEVAKDKAYENYLKALSALNDATIYAPFDGVVAYVSHPNPGVNIIYNQAQYEIVDPETIYFEVTADQTEVVRLKEGDYVGIVLDSFSEKEFSGSISEIAISPSQEEIGVSYAVKVEFDGVSNEDFEYRLGMTGDASFVLEEVKDVLYVDPKFINRDEDGKSFVYINKKKDKVEVEIGVEGEDRVEIKGDFNEGDLIWDD